MALRSANLIARAIRLVPLVACVFGGCTCSGGLGSHPTPTVTPTTRPTQTPTTAPRPTDTAVVPPPEAVATLPPATLPPTPNLEATATGKRSECESYFAVLSGKSQDKAMLANPDLQRLGGQAPDLVACGAVARDSDELCMLLGPNPEQGRTKECLLTQALFHEVRAYPKGRSFFMTEAEWRECQTSPYSPICDTLREALRSGDASKCALKADFLSISRKLVTDLDESQCRIAAPWIKRITETKCRAAVALDKGVCHAERADLKSGQYSKEMEESFKNAEVECKQKIEERAFLGKGLKALAASASPHERELAKAALGQADACAPYKKAAMDKCMEGTMPAPGAPVPSGTSPPTGTSSGPAPGP